MLVHQAEPAKYPLATLDVLGVREGNTVTFDLATIREKLISVLVTATSGVDHLVVDGDTLTIKTKDITLFRGIDLPEHKPEFYGSPDPGIMPGIEPSFTPEQWRTGVNLNDITIPKGSGEASDLAPATMAQMNDLAEKILNSAENDPEVVGVKFAIKPPTSEFLTQEWLN